MTFKKALIIVLGMAMSAPYRPHRHPIDTYEREALDEVQLHIETMNEKEDE